MIRLIINADDFGFSKSVNEAVFELANIGSLTSTTVMVNMPFKDDVKDLLQFDEFGIGLHFNLTQGKSISMADEVSSLVNSRGEFYNFSDFRKRSKKGLIEKKHILCELNAQFGLLHDLIGDRLDHIDSHQAVHKYKPVSDAFMEFKIDSKKIGLRSPRHFFIKKGSSPINPSLKNIFEFGAKRLLVESYYRWLSKKFSDKFYLPEGELLAMNFKKIDTLKLLGNISTSAVDATIEISCHPAIRIDDLPKSKLTGKRVTEYQIMKSDQFIKSLDKFNLITFKNLPK